MHIIVGTHRYTINLYVKLLLLQQDKALWITSTCALSFFISGCNINWNIILKWSLPHSKKHCFFVDTRRVGINMFSIIWLLIFERNLLGFTLCISTCDKGIERANDSAKYLLRFLYKRINLLFPAWCMVKCRVGLSLLSQLPYPL